MDGIIKVDPQQLISMSEEFSTAGTTINNLTSEMINIVNSMGSAYIGDAATTYISKTNALQDDITKLNTMIQEHVTDLQDMATQYMQAESGAMSDAEALQTSVIS
jgi:WXG100 family type VII secretion target